MNGPTGIDEASMRVGCVTRHHYPTAQEIRVTKFGAAYKAERHDFFVFCPRRSDQSSTERFEYGNIIRPKIFLGPFLERILFAVVPINPIWLFWFVYQFLSKRLDLVIVRDLRLALPAIVAARICGMKSILDIGEHYPGMMEIVGKTRLIHHLIRNAWLIRRLEILSVRWADNVWVVVDENKQRLSRYSSQIDVINNYPVASIGGADLRAVPREYSEHGDPVRIVSLGVIDNIRGLDLAVEAFGLLIKELPNVQLVLHGDGFFREALQAQVRQLGLDDSVYFGGWVAEADKYKLLADGDVGLILHKMCDLTQHTIPNKLFDFMYVGVPILSTQLKPVERILLKEKCGDSVAENAVAVAAGMRSLVLDVEKRRRYSRNGIEAVYARYRWESEAAKVIKNSRTLLQQGSAVCS